MSVYLSELQEKDIISINTGLNYGHIIDVQINDEGKIIKLVAEPQKLFKKFSVNSEIAFTYEDIKKIGKDVILVNI